MRTLHFQPAGASRESAFSLLCAFCDGNARNQRVIFAEFPLLLQHMSTVRKATTCAKLVLSNHAENCAAVTEAHLTQLRDRVEALDHAEWLVDVEARVPRQTIFKD